jgi:hypothetical protein
VRFGLADRFVITRVISTAVISITTASHSSSFGGAASRPAALLQHSFLPRETNEETRLLRSRAPFGVCEISSVTTKVTTSEDDTDQWIVSMEVRERGEGPSCSEDKEIGLEVIIMAWGNGS